MVSPVGRSVSFLAASLVALAFSVSAAAEAPDVKFLFPAGLQQGQSRTVKVEGKPGTSPHRVWTSDERLSGTPDETGEQLEFSAADDLPPGLIWARLANDEGASKLLPVVVGLLPEVTEAKLQESDQRPELPTTISGVLSKGGEVDAYSVSLEAGQTLIASIDSHRLLDSPADMVLQLVSDRGFVIAQNDDHHGFDPQIVHSATDSGTYRIRLFAFPAEPNSTIGFAGGKEYVYRLTLTTGPFVDHLFPLGLDPHPEAKLQVCGFNLPDSESLPPAAAHEAMFANVHHPGSFLVSRLQRSVAPVMTEGDQADTKPQALPIPGSLCGHISLTNETDTYTINAKAGQTLAVSVAAQSFDSPLDPILRITDTDGKLIKEADDLAKDNADIRTEVKIPADGEYRLSVTDRFAHGGMRYVYLLSVEEPQPGFRLTIDKTQFTVTAEKPLEIPVAIQRLGGFSDKVVVSIAGLPEGVTCPPVESKMEGDSAKSVKLKVETSGAAASGGTVTIVGECEGFDPIHATSQTPVAGITIEDIWLTIVPAKSAKSEPTPSESEEPSR